jgi:hypothetical protein
MSTELTDQLRDDIARVPARVPPGLARIAYRRYRRRRAATRAISVTGVAAVAAIATAVSLSGPDGASRPTGQTTAELVSHISQAMDAVPAGTIEFDRETITLAGKTTATERWITTGRIRTDTRTPSGQLLDSYGSITTPTTYQAIDVSYSKKSWSLEKVTDQGSPAPSPGSASLPTCTRSLNVIPGLDNRAQAAAWFRAEVSCGQLKAAGTGTVDGASVVKLIFSRPGATFCFWMDTATYLPVRETQALHETMTSQDDFQWLPPTAANRAKLRLPVPPAGFTQIPTR